MLQAPLGSQIEHCLFRTLWSEAHAGSSCSEWHPAGVTAPSTESKGWKVLDEDFWTPKQRQVRGDHVGGKHYGPALKRHRCFMDEIQTLSAKKNSAFIIASIFS